MSTAAPIEARAAEWLMASEQPGWSDEQQAALDAWLEESFEHRAAFWRLEYGWTEADRISALGPQRPARSIWTTWQAQALAACFVALAACAVLFTLTLRKPAEAYVAYGTVVGGKSTVTLKDGSVVQLNTATDIRASISSVSRELSLDRGEAFFEIAHDAARPFVIHIGQRNLTVLGTKFSVRRETDGSSIAVTDGRVQLDEAGTGLPQSVIIKAGNYAVARGSSVLLSRLTPDMEMRLLSWRTGKLYFSNTRLADAVAEFNRYNDRKMSVISKEVGDIRIAGAFEASNATGFSRLLADGLGLKVKSSKEAIQISH